MRLFAGLPLDKTIPDHSTILKFHHQLERYQLARQTFEELSQWLPDASVLQKMGRSLMPL